jgi:hypothetical protein
VTCLSSSILRLGLFGALSLGSRTPESISDCTRFSLRRSCSSVIFAKYCWRCASTFLSVFALHSLRFRARSRIYARFTSDRKDFLHSMRSRCRISGRVIVRPRALGIFFSSSTKYSTLRLCKGDLSDFKKTLRAFAMSHRRGSTPAVRWRATLLIVS